MRKIKDVLRLKLQAGLSHERIAAALSVSKGAVTKYCILAATCGLDWPTVAELSETALERRLLAGRADRPSHYVAPDFGLVHQEMRRKGMTLTLLWEEYVEAHPDQATWRYTQFCEHYHRYCLRLKRSMRQVHRAGEKLFVDYAGPTIALEGEGVANIFVAALGASSFTYACATPRQTLADWLHGCAQALRFIGGVPQLIVPDNPRALIADPNRYEPRANETVEDSIPSARVVRVLNQLVEIYGRPEAIRLDNGPELTADAFVDWAEENGVKLLFIQPGKPNQNAFIERFNRSFRQEVLDAWLFNAISEVQDAADAWLTGYNEYRSHDSLCNKPPPLFRLSV